MKRKVDLTFVVRPSRQNNPSLFVGCLRIEIINNMYHHIKHGEEPIDLVAIGDYNQVNSTYDFVANVNIYQLLNLPILNINDSITGSFSIKWNKDLKTKSILTLVPPDYLYIETCLINKTDIIGDGILEYTKNSTLPFNKIQVIYCMSYKGVSSCISSIRFSIPVSKIVESKEVIAALESDVINDIKLT